MEKKVNFGLGIATGTEGLMYPIPYASVREVVDISILAEKLVKGDIIDRQMIFGHSFLHSCSSFLHRYVQKGLL